MMSFKRFRALTRRHFGVEDHELKLRRLWEGKKALEEYGEAGVKRNYWAECRRKQAENLERDMVRNMQKRMFLAVGVRNQTDSVVFRTICNLMEKAKDPVNFYNVLTDKETMLRAAKDPKLATALLSQAQDVALRVRSWPVKRCTDPKHRAFGKPLNECRTRSCLLKLVHEE